MIDTTSMTTIDTYTAAHSPAMRPAAPKAGDRYRTPADGEPDGREWADWSRLMTAAGLRGEYEETVADADGREWSVYEVVSTLESRDRGRSVVDDEGGRWWPSDEAAEEIARADDPAAAAVTICSVEPMRGRWAD